MNGPPEATGAAAWRDEPRWLRAMADPRLFAAACAWLIVLVVLGTLAQRELGLYLAQERYFTAWFLWCGPLPLPGGRLTLTLSGLSLLAVLFTRRSAGSPGLFLLHAGTLLLLAGCLVGSALRQEGSLALREGGRGAEMRSWLHHELAVRVEGRGQDRLLAIGERLLRPGAVLTHPDLPLALTVVELQANARPGPGGTLEGLAADALPELNSPALVLALPDGRRQPLFASGGEAVIAPGVQAGLRRVTTAMPFALELQRFRVEHHPGTGLPRHFAAELLVHEGAAARRVVVSMNQPLRLGSWTVYLQSYGEAFDGAPSAEFAVVRDRFQLSPYVASALMLAGLLLHLVQRLRGGGGR